MDFTIDKPKPAPPASRERALSTLKNLSNTRPIDSAESQSVVGDLQNRFAVLGFHTQRNVSPFRGVFNGVVQEIDDDLLQAGPVALDPHPERMLHKPV